MPTLRELRQQKNWSREELAVKARLTVRTIAAAETGKPVLVNTVKRLCDALGVRLEDVSGVTLQQKKIARK